MVTAAKEPAGLVPALLIGPQKPLGPCLALLGCAVLADDPVVTGAIMRFAAEGILFLTCSGIAVHAHVADRQAPAAVTGFCLRLLGAVLAGQAVGAERASGTSAQNVRLAVADLGFATSVGRSVSPLIRSAQFSPTEDMQSAGRQRSGGRASRPASGLADPVLTVAFPSDRGVTTRRRNRLRREARRGVHARDQGRLDESMPLAGS